MKWPETLVLDGEYYEGTYHVFDLYRAGGNLDTRYRQLAHVVRQFSADYPIQIMPRWEKIAPTSVRWTPATRALSSSPEPISITCLHSTRRIRFGGR